MERRLMDAPPLIAKDRLRGKKHYIIITNRITYVAGQAKGGKNDRPNDVLQNNYYYFIYYIIAETACRPFVGVD